MIKLDWNYQCTINFMMKSLTVNAMCGCVTENVGAYHLFLVSWKERGISHPGTMIGGLVNIKRIAVVPLLKF